MELHLLRLTRYTTTRDNALAHFLGNAAGTLRATLHCRHSAENWTKVKH